MQNEIPDIIQEISFSIEVIGFYLAFVELFYSNISDAIERLIDDSQKPLLEKSILLRNRTITLFKWSIAKILIIGLLLATIILFILNGMVPDPDSLTDYYDTVIKGIPPVDYREAQREAISKMMPYIKYLTFFILGLYLSLAIATSSLFILHLMAKSCSKLIEKLNRITNGKALGAIGIILATIGLIGEGVQIIFLSIEGATGIGYFLLNAILFTVVIVSFIKLKKTR